MRKQIGIRQKKINSHQKEKSSQEITINRLNSPQQNRLEQRSHIQLRLITIDGFAFLLGVVVLHRFVLVDSTQDISMHAGKLSLELQHVDKVVMFLQKVWQGLRVLRIVRVNQVVIDCDSASVWVLLIVGQGHFARPSLTKANHKSTVGLVHQDPFSIGLGYKPVNQPEQQEIRTK